MIIKIIAAFFASLLFSVVFNIAKKNLIYCGLIGSVGWSVYLVVLAAGRGPIMATFVGSISITVLAYMLAAYRKSPASVFLVPGIIPLVPGYPLYQSIYYYTQQDYELFQAHSFEAAGIAISIAIAVITISAIHRFIKRY